MGYAEKKINHEDLVEIGRNQAGRKNINKKCERNPEFWRAAR